MSAHLTPAQIKSLLLNGADQSPSLLGTSVSQGQLNIANALAGKTGTRVDASQLNPIFIRPRPGPFWGLFSVDPISPSTVSSITSITKHRNGDVLMEL